MKNTILILILFNCFCGFAQMPKNLIVVAENLNFREKPTTQSRVIDQLDNSELLETIELVKKEEWGIYNYDFKKSWIKVRRKMTGEVGYVFGKYVLSQNVAYPYYSVVERIQTGYWYGIHQIRDSTRFYSIIPILEGEIEPCSGEKFLRLLSKDKPVDILFCLQRKLNIDEFVGQMIPKYQSRSWISINKKKTFKFSKKIELTFESLGVKDYSKRIEQEKILLKISYPTYEQNFDLTNDLMKFGEGYSIEFLGDLNDDGIPDFFLQETTNHGGAFYFFMSNENGEIELQSISWSTNEC